IKLAIGTAFTYAYEEQLYLVTNWHNVTGREPGTLKAKNKDAGIPDRLSIRIPVIVEVLGEKKLDPRKLQVLEWREYTMLLYKDIGDCDPTKPVWYEHPQYGYQVDVVVAPITFPEKVFIYPANDPKLNLSRVLLRPSLDVFVLGFPVGMSGGANLPVWKRGSIASEPDIDVDNLPKILIDTATRKGMSGAPVYLSKSGYFHSEEKYKTGEYKIHMGEARKFLGVYSGRIGEDNFLAQLGVVWKSTVIEEIIQGEKIGKSSFELCPSR
ncbi:MAG: hypothetical protein AAF696_36705, partial [Bacteroidota bacterium]